MRIVKFPSERRQEILETAQQLFLQHGINKTSVSRICREIGIAHGLIYYYFRSKDEIVEAVLGGMLSRFTEKSVNTLERTDITFPHKLYILLQDFLELYSAHNPIVSAEHRLLSVHSCQVTPVLTQIGARIHEEGRRCGFFGYEGSGLLLTILIGGSLRIFERDTAPRGELVEVIFNALSVPLPDTLQTGNTAR